MSDVDISKLKVVELKAELQARGLDTKGNKAVLVKRLQDAIDAGEEEGESGVVSAGGGGDEGIDQSPEESQGSTTNPAIGDEQDDSCSKPEASLGDPEESTDDSQTEPAAAPAVEQPFAEESESCPEPEPTPMKRESGEEGAEDSQPVAEEMLQVKQEPMDTAQPAQVNGEPPEVKSEIGAGDAGPDVERPGKRKRSRTPEQERFKPLSAPVKVEEFPEDDFDKTLVTLDIYNSDLNLCIDKSRYSAEPLCQLGFGLMWAGARASYGVLKGKICFETKISKYLDVSHLPPDEPTPNVTRVGFSVELSSMQLGEEPFSYGYGGTGKASVDCKFKDYGEAFAEGDVILGLLDMDSDPVRMSFAKNGRDLGTAFEVPKDKLLGQALFPHVLSKNCAFEVNFGQRESPWFPVPAAYESYTFLACVPLDERLQGTQGPKKKAECEMIMMCGLPGCGKTTWANEFTQKQPERKYNILGTNNIIDKMKVMGLPRKRNYSGRWDVLIDKSTKCLNKLLELASKTPRNYILDQTNVYPTAQRRKMRPFEGFRRRAVVIVPTDEEFQRRCAKREKEEGKDVPDIAVLEMKANFVMPEEGSLFDEVTFTELPRDQAAPLVKQYNEEGRAACGPPQSRFRSGGGGFENNHRGGFGDNRGGGGGYRQPFRGGFDRRRPFPRGGPPGGGGFRGGPPRGGFGQPFRGGGGGGGGGGFHGGGSAGGGGFRGGPPSMRGGPPPRPDMRRGGGGGPPPRGGMGGGGWGGGGGGGNPRHTFPAGGGRPGPAPHGPPQPQQVRPYGGGYGAYGQQYSSYGQQGYPQQQQQQQQPGYAPPAQQVTAYGGAQPAPAPYVPPQAPGQQPGAYTAQQQYQQYQQQWNQYYQNQQQWNQYYQQQGYASGGGYPQQQAPMPARK